MIDPFDRVLEIRALTDRSEEEPADPPNMVQHPPVPGDPTPS